MSDIGGDNKKLSDEILRTQLLFWREEINSKGSLPINAIRCITSIRRVYLDQQHEDTLADLSKIPPKDREEMLRQIYRARKQAESDQSENGS